MENPTLGSSTNGSMPTVDNAEETQSKQNRLAIIGAVLGVVVLIALMVGGVIYLVQPNSPTSTIRDVVIIALGVELLLLGISTVILIFQLARLINLVQNEVQPVLESANETISTLRGTATFLSDNLVGPVVKVNGYVAAIRRMLGIINFGK